MFLRAAGGAGERVHQAERGALHAAERPQGGHGHDARLTRFRQEGDEPHTTSF